MRAVCASLIALSLAGASAAAEEAAAAKPEEKKEAAKPMEAPKPAAELAALAKMAGNWKCAGKMQMPPEMGGAEVDTKSKVTIKKDLDGFWLTGTVQADKIKSMPKTMPAMKSTFVWGYDPVEKKYVEVAFDNTGGMMHSTSAGIQDKTWSWSGTGVMMGKKMNTRSTVTEKSDKEVAILMEVEGEPGKWMKMGEDACKK